MRSIPSLVHQPKATVACAPRAVPDTVGSGTYHSRESVMPKISKESAQVAGRLGG
jgi:hypothetical protein